MGLITHDQLQQTINTMTDAQNTIENAKSQLVSLGVKKLSVIRARNQQNEQRDQAILEQTEKISLLKNQKERGTDVKSPYRGLVVQVPFFQGQIVSRGQTLVQVEHDDVELVVMILLDKGSESIKKGMATEISPSGIKIQQYGFMLGKIHEISFNPVTKQALMGYLHNESLVAELTGNRAAVMLFSNLKKDTSAFSGFEWSSSKGPDITLQAGTICNVQIVTKTQKPISLLIPYLKEKTGL